MLSQQSEEAKLAYYEAKCRVRKTKNEEWIRLGKEMERDTNEMQKRFWSKVKAKERGPTTHIQGLDGELRSREEALSRWREHFDNLLNGKAGSGEEIRMEGREVQGEDEQIGVEEVRRAVRKMKRGKAGGACGIQVEMVKAGGYTLVQWLKEVLNVVWRSGKPPQEWTRGGYDHTYIRRGVRESVVNTEE